MDPKVKEKAQWGFEIASLEIAVQHISLYAMRNPLPLKNIMESGEVIYKREKRKNEKDGRN